MSSEPKPIGQKEGDATAKAFEQAYKESHPNGPYPPMEIKPKPEQSQQPSTATTTQSPER